MFEIRILDPFGQADEMDLTIDDLNSSTGHNAETAAYCYTSRSHAAATAGSPLVAG